MKWYSAVLFPLFAVALIFSFNLVAESDLYTNSGSPATYAPMDLASVPDLDDLAGRGPIQVDLSPGVGAPPSTLGGYTMIPVPYPGAPNCTYESPPITTPGGSMDIAPWDGLNRCIGDGWMTWSHDYVGDVYYTGGSTVQTLTPPAGTLALYFYVEPNPFEIHNFIAVATGSDASACSTGVFTADGDAGAAYVGFWSTDPSVTIVSVEINCEVDFASGEYGWSGELPELDISCPDPGIAGQINDLVATGGTPGNVVAFLYGIADGQTEALPVCEGTFIDIDKARLAGVAIVDGTGTATITRYIPERASGLTILVQALEVQTCIKSDRESCTLD
jgi:hypothetical protein